MVTAVKGRTGGVFKHDKTARAGAQTGMGGMAKKSQNLLHSGTKGGETTAKPVEMRN